MNAPAVDLFAAKGPQNIRIAVKTTGSSSDTVQWSGLRLVHEPREPRRLPHVRRPRERGGGCAAQGQRALAPVPKRDGTPRKRSKHTALRWMGKDTETNIGHGFAEKWAKYEDAWDLLEQRPSS
jgi:hypothetical protein